MSFITATVDVKLVEVADEGMISAGLRGVLRIKIDPLLLNRLKLSQIIEIDTTFACVPAEEEYTVFEAEAVGTGARGGLLVVPSLGATQTDDLLPIVRKGIKRVELVCTLFKVSSTE